MSVGVSPPSEVAAPRRPVGASSAEETAVLLCSDVAGVGPSPVSVALLAATLRTRAPEARIFVVEDLCSNLAAVSATLKALAARRVAIGCRNTAANRLQILERLRRGGIRPGASP